MHRRKLPLGRHRPQKSDAQRCGRRGADASSACTSGVCSIKAQLIRRKRLAFAMPPMREGAHNRPRGPSLLLFLAPIVRHCTRDLESAVTGALRPHKEYGCPARLRGRARSRRPPDCNGPNSMARPLRVLALRHVDMLMDARRTETMAGAWTRPGPTSLGVQDADQAQTQGRYNFDQAAGRSDYGHDSKHAERCRRRMVPGRLGVQDADGSDARSSSSWASPDGRRRRRKSFAAVRLTRNHRRLCGAALAPKISPETPDSQVLVRGRRQLLPSPGSAQALARPRPTARGGRRSPSRARRSGRSRS